MPFTKIDLQAVLNNDESFCKKIKIADRAFKSSEFCLPHKEVVLIEWVIRNLPNNPKAWEVFNNWISSNQFKELSRNDISNDEIANIIELFKEELILKQVDSQMLKALLNSFLVLKDNIIFQQYFKYHIEHYCSFLSSFFIKIGCLSDLEDFLVKDLFLKTVISEEKFQKYFLDSVLPVLVQCLVRFGSSGKVFQEASKVVQRCIFYKNHKTFKIFINQFYEETNIEKQALPRTFFKKLIDFYGAEADTAALGYKLIFHSFCHSYNLDFELLYRFFVLLVHIIGFNLKEKIIFYKTSKLEITNSQLSQNKSQKIILELLSVLVETKNNLDCKVEETAFSDFVRNILKQFLYLNITSDICYRVFIKAIMINPTVIEPITEDIIVYAMKADNNQNKEYETLIISVFEVYSKLHRIENLIAKIVRALSEHFNGIIKTVQEIYEFKGINDTEVRVIEQDNLKVEHILTENIMKYFSTCICNLASWQVINVFKTLLYYLRNELDYASKVLNEDPKHFMYMEILSVLICTLLSSIRIAEHTVANNVVEKSIKELEELKSLLENFGIVLLNREHNHILMRSFLNIAYHWAEMYLILSYYSVGNDVRFKKLLDNDFSSCNITYMHPYLNVKQWCLISERITNFGELPCKQLLNKLYIQKLRAMSIFEKSVNDDIVTNVLRSITIDLEHNWKDILYDKYVVNHLLSKMDSGSVIFLAESLITTNNFQKLSRESHILNSSLLLTAVNYVTIVKVNKLLLKQKRKLDDNTFKTAMSSKICMLLTEDIFLSKDDHKDTIEKAKQIYQSSGNNEKTADWRINEEKIIDLFEIFKKFPIISTSEVAQKLYLIYFASVHRDLCVKFEQGNYRRLQTNCEKLIIGVLQHGKFQFLDLFDIQLFCKEVIKSYKEWELIFSLVTENIFRCEHLIESYDSVVTDFTENLSNPMYMHCCIRIITAVNKVLYKYFTI